LFEREVLIVLLPDGVRCEVPLKPFTSYRIGGPAKYYSAPSVLEDLLELLQWAKHESLPIFVLGGGTNVLVSDRGFPGLVIHLRNFLTNLSDIQAGGRWTVGAGTALTPWVRRTVYEGFQGVEDLIGIPGTIGGALRMNAGAFTGEISRPLLNVEVLDAHLRLNTLEKREVRFSYRRAPELEDKIILKARFILERGDAKRLKLRLREVLRLRREKQPLESPSCGSVFKRPEGDYAGRLIEEAGLKGITCGGAQVSPKHANFIVNLGYASAADVLKLIKHIKKKVKEVFGIELQREIVLVGFREEELIGT
jgi:UDP-N-acetylmuramate dehydrogenase